MALILKSDLREKLHPDLISGHLVTSPENDQNWNKFQSQAAASLGGGEGVRKCFPVLSQGRWCLKSVSNLSRV